MSRTHDKAYWFNKETKESVFEEDFFRRFPESAEKLKRIAQKGTAGKGHVPSEQQAAPEAGGGRKRYGRWREWLRFKSSKGYFFWSNPNTQESMVEEDFFKRYPDARKQGEGGAGAQRVPQVDDAAHSAPRASAPPSKRARGAEGEIRRCSASSAAQRVAIAVPLTRVGAPSATGTCRRR